MCACVEADRCAASSTSQGLASCFLTHSCTYQNRKDGTLIITKTLEGGPADGLSAIMEGDILVAINDTFVRKLGVCAGALASACANVACVTIHAGRRQQTKHMLPSHPRPAVANHN